MICDEYLIFVFCIICTGYVSHHIGFKAGVTAGNITILHLVQEYLKLKLGKSETADLFDNKAFESWIYRFLTDK